MSVEYIEYTDQEDSGVLCHGVWQSHGNSELSLVPVDEISAHGISPELLWEYLHANIQGDNIEARLYLYKVSKLYTEATPIAETWWSKVMNKPEITRLDNGCVAIPEIVAIRFLEHLSVQPAKYPEVARIAKVLYKVAYSFYSSWVDYSPGEEWDIWRQANYHNLTGVA